ncbi:MAG: response regulator [Flavisolibacter sp.]|nr:response regulator [Flavisolibacter sp.]
MKNNEAVHKPLILIVDDDPDDIFFLQEMLLTLYPETEIVEAYDGLAALAIINDLQERGRIPDVVVIDINMPVMDGRELIAHLRSGNSTKELNLIVYTTSSNYFDNLICKQHNAELILKPSDMSMLEKAARIIYRMGAEKPLGVREG